MTRIKSILLLAGSAEARQIAADLVVQGLEVRALMSQEPRGPNPMPVPYDVCAKPDAVVLAAAMKGADAVIDASHGFDAAMTDAGYAAARAAGTPFVTFVRPGWDPAENPLWRAVRDIAGAMALIPQGARVFSAAGWASLPECATFAGSVLLLRQTSAHRRPVPYDFVEPVFGAPPFTVESEVALFRNLAVDILICRNLGGRPSRPKLDAAAGLGLPVLLIDRPVLPSSVPCVKTVDAALDWVARL